jgi:hypothetical protein
MPKRTLIRTLCEQLTLLAQEPTMQSVEQFLSELSIQRFYGSVEIKFEAGRAVLLRKTETIKPIDEACRDNRGNRHDNGR